MLELERTYLVKTVPADLGSVPCFELTDTYYPAESEHPVLRLRTKAGKLELTKKQPAQEGDSSQMIEQTIELSPEEYAVLEAVPGRRVSKIRYEYPYKGLVAEFDVFQEALSGLVLVDFEFSTPEEKDRFEMPEFCLAEVTQEQFIAGGMLCGKVYADISERLAKFAYAPLSLP